MTGVTICPHCWKEQCKNMKPIVYDEQTGFVGCEVHGKMTGEEIISLYQAQGIGLTAHQKPDLPRFELGTVDK